MDRTIAQMNEELQRLQAYDTVAKNTPACQPRVRSPVPTTLRSSRERD